MKTMAQTIKIRQAHINALKWIFFPNWALMIPAICYFANLQESMEWRNSWWSFVNVVILVVNVPAMTYGAILFGQIEAKLRREADYPSEEDL